MTTVNPWQPGFLYQPGDLVRATNSGVVTQPEIDDPDFELGGTGWTQSGSGDWAYDAFIPPFSGTKAVRNQMDDPGHALLTNNERIPVVPGQEVVVRCYVYCYAAPNDTRAQIRINWYSSGLALISTTDMASSALVTPGVNGGYPGASAFNVWVPIEVDGVAPAGAAFWSAAIAFNATDEETGWATDNFTASYANVEPANTFLFRAVQAAAGFSGNVEPDWPTVIGNTVVDNDVTWEAVSGNSVTWQASRILVSGTVEPTWPLIVGGAVNDNTITWTLNSRRVTDEHAPQTPFALIASSKILAPDGDIIDYSATVNALDWSTPDDAGYIPFGLQQYGANPITAMGLYRGNVAAFNSQGCQIWQVNEDPAAITLLDAAPLPCTYPKSVQPVGDDLAFLSNLGIRSLGIAGAQVNLQGGYFGKQVDPLVVAAIMQAIDEGWTPRGLYWPAHGQYWLFFGPQAFVLTINGDKREQRSWARYVFPWVVDAWTILGTDLYLRAGDLVEKVDATVLQDDEHETPHGTVGTPFVSVIHWPFLDLNSFNQDKELVGFDLAITGECAVSFGWNQRVPTYSVGANWTAAYTITDDTVPAQMIPFSLSGPSFAMRLEFASGQSWEWWSANLYIKDLKQ